MHATALIAEDEALLAAEMKAQLARVWPALEIVATVGHGAAAVEAALRLRPQVLFLDIRMPGMSGLELADVIAGTMRALPIVFITGHADDDVRAQAAASGAVALLDKPVADTVLLEAIERGLERSLRR